MVAVRASAGAINVAPLPAGSGNSVLAIQANSHVFDVLMVFTQFIRRAGASAGSASFAVAETVTVAPVSANTSAAAATAGKLFSGPGLSSFGFLMAFAKLSRPPVEV